MTKLKITFCIQIRKLLGASTDNERILLFLISSKLKHVARRYKSS